MATFEIKLVINRPIEEVFEFISNPENLPRWRASALQVTKLSPDQPLGVGSLYRSRYSFLGRAFEATIEIIARQSASHYAGRIIEGPFPLETRYTLEPDASQTRLSMIAEGEPGGFFKLAEPLVISMAKRSFEADFQNLKELLEAQAVQLGSDL